MRLFAPARIALALGLFFGALLNQAADDSPEPVAAPAAEATPAPTIRLSIVDKRMATVLAIDQQAEIELAQYAISHAAREEVKQYAQQVAAETAAFLKSWDERTGGQISLGTRRIAESNENVAHREGETAAGDSPGRAPFALLNAERTLMHMKLEITQQCAQAALAELGATPTTDLDRSYLDHQLFRQMEMLATLKVLQRYATPRLAPLLEEAGKLAQRHFDQAKAILTTLPVTHPGGIERPTLTAAGG